MRYAAIDIGTNAARLLIGEITESKGFFSVKKISYTRVPLQLGYDVFEKGEISEKKQKAFIKTIKAFKLLSEVFEVDDLRACATSAMREAKNGKSIKKEIKKLTDINIEIIDGEEEGDLILSALDLIRFDRSKSFMVIDVGGGSTEISIYKDGKRLISRSFKIGTIRLLKDKVDPDTKMEMNEWINAKIKIDNNLTVFATGGNINKAHKLLGHKLLEPVSTNQLNTLLADLTKLSVAERIAYYKFKEDRARVIVPALEIYTFILNTINVKEVVVPKLGLSDGIIFSLFKKAN